MPANIVSITLAAGSSTRMPPGLRPKSCVFRLSDRDDLLTFNTLEELEEVRRVCSRRESA